MANISKHTQKSRLTKSQSRRGAPVGIPSNCQDFSELSAESISSSQEFKRKHWHYMSKHMVKKAGKLSQSYKGIPVDNDNINQFSFGF